MHGTSSPKHPSVFPDWFQDLPLQQQSVLVLALRGPDNVRKHHPCKEVQRHYRGTILSAAKFGRHLHLGEAADTFMSMERISKAPHSQENWILAVKQFTDTIDELPHHYIAHIMHGAQILGYHHPDEMVRAAWHFFYYTLADDAHLPMEAKEVMDDRLSDWHRKYWDNE